MDDPIEPMHEDQSASMARLDDAIAKFAAAVEKFTTTVETAMIAKLEAKRPRP